MTSQTRDAAALSVTREQVEVFLYQEAALLDAWRLDEWLALFVEGARYLVPPAGAEDDVDPSDTLFYIADDYFRLSERVKRLSKRTAHVEFPKSRCRRLVSNVLLLDGTDECFRAASNFVTYRTKGGTTETYLGHHIYELAVNGGNIKIRQKTSFIDTDNINDQGKISIII